MKNYYKILGVDVLSPPEDIKRAYRKMAKTYHPDRHPDDPDASLKFQEACEAYEILSDPDERFKYDRQLKYVITPAVQCEEPIAQSKSYSNIKRAFMIACTMIIILGLLFIIQASYFQNMADKTLRPNMTVDTVLANFGEPNTKDASQWTYKNSIILIRNDKVIGWYDVDNYFNIKNKKITNISEIVVGEELDNIFDVYGYPDVYGKTFLVYHDIVILYKNNKVIDVYKI